jgi:hypothetical protein
MGNFLFSHRIISFYPSASKYKKDVELRQITSYTAESDCRVNVEGSSVCFVAPDKSLGFLV